MCHGEGVSVINHLHIVFMTFDAEGPLLGFNLCGSQEIVENSERDGNTRPLDLPLEKLVCRSGSNS